MACLYFGLFYLHCEQVKKVSDDESDEDPLASSESEGDADSIRGSDEDFRISESSSHRYQIILLVHMSQ